MTSRDGDDEMFELDRFKRAQEGEGDGRPAGFAAAIAELRAGHKTSHWIWYVFPQLSGLGQSPMAVRYGLAGAEEAVAYLRDPVLLQRLAAATAAVRAHAAPDRRAGKPLDDLMGSQIDARKLVSSLTLFAFVAAKLRREGDSRPELAALAADAEAVLVAASAQGFERCAYTEEQLGAGLKH
jgi:uncharacterized protein (DUF1810 family)